MDIIGIIFLLFVVAIISAMSKWATDQKYKRKYEEKLRKHDLHYNSLDPNSPYSERECCGSDCGCHTEEKVVDMKSSGDM